MELPVPILSAMPFVALSLAPNRWQFNRPLGGTCFYCSFVVVFGFRFGFGSGSRFLCSSVFSVDSFSFFAHASWAEKLRTQFVAESRGVTTLRAFSRAYLKCFNWAPVTPELITHPNRPLSHHPPNKNDHLEWLLRGGPNIQHTNGHFYERRSIVLVKSLI